MSSSQLINIPTLAIHPRQINLYYERVWNGTPKLISSDTLAQLKHDRKVSHLLDSSRTAEGKVSPIAKRKIVKAIDYLLLFASDKQVNILRTGRKFNFKIAFITLTLPSKQIHSDNEIKRECLNQFIIEIQKYYHVKHYVWRAELQDNGNIHFHIICDKFIHWNEVRNRWNRIINKLGYVDRYQQNMKEFYKDGFKIRENLKHNWSELKQRKAYEANLRTDFHNPNSTDIHSIKKVRNLTQYFIKYLTKNKEDETFSCNAENEKKTQTGRIWGSSRSLQNITGAKVVLDSEIEYEINKILEQTRAKVYHSDYYSVFNITIRDCSIAGSGRIYKKFLEYLVNEFDYHSQLSFDDNCSNVKKMEYVDYI